MWRGMLSQGRGRLMVVVVNTLLSMCRFGGDFIFVSKRFRKGKKIMLLN